MFANRNKPAAAFVGTLSARFGRLLIAIPQGVLALLPGIVLAALRPLLKNDSLASSRPRHAGAAAGGAIVGLILTGVFVGAAFGVVKVGLLLLSQLNILPRFGTEVLMVTGGMMANVQVVPSASRQLSIAVGVCYSLALFTPWFCLGLSEASFGMLVKLLAMRIRVVSFVGRIVGAVMLLGLSLLPLSALLLIFPSIYAQESVLTDTVIDVKNRWRKFLRRVFYFFTGVALLIALLASATEIVTLLNLKSPYFGKLVRMTPLPASLLDRLPKAMVDQWPYVLVIIYATDLLMLFGIAKIPLNYNIRNLAVRWRTTVLTGLAFTVVLALLTAMLAFVNGLNNLTSNSGIAGNVFVLSEGATDELFSSLYKGDIRKILDEYTEIDENGYRLPTRVRIKEMPAPNGNVKLCSFETYYVLNHPVAVSAGEKPRRRFVQLRGIEDGLVAAKVHNIVLSEGEWFGREGAVAVERDSSRTATPAVLGEGAAAKFAEDMHVSRLRAGDRFKMVDEDMVVCGIMKSEGSTFGSEVWVTWDWASKHFNKDQYTTIVLRVSDDSEMGARAFAKHLSLNFKNPRVRAVDEPKYFEDLGKSNDQLLFSVILVAIVMAIGGVFGVMNTMFAAIAQRTTDIGILRILGFKRWQILVSFMLESLGIALLGGIAGIAIGSLFDGVQMTSNVSAGQGSGKTVIMKLAFDTDIVICGLLFTIVMGRVGGLVPSLSAMRTGILDSLR